MTAPADALPGEQYTLSKSQIALTSARVDLAYRRFVSGWTKSKSKNAIKQPFGAGWRAAKEIVYAARPKRGT